MFRQKFHLTVKGMNDKLYEFFCDCESPVGEIYDAIRTMESVVVKYINQQQETVCDKPEEAQKQPEEPKAE